MTLLEEKDNALESIGNRISELEKINQQLEKEKQEEDEAVKLEWENALQNNIEREIRDLHDKFQVEKDQFQSQVFALRNDLNQKTQELNSLNSHNQLLLNRIELLQENNQRDFDAMNKKVVHDS